MIRAESRLTSFAIHHRISEATNVPARFPYFRIHNDRTIHPHHRNFLAVRPRRRVADHVLPPGVLDVFLQLDAERAIAQEAVDAAVDFARLEDESLPAAQGDEFVHVHQKLQWPVASDQWPVTREEIVPCFL